MYTKKHLGPSCLRENLSARFSAVTDTRQKAKSDHLMHDVLMGGLAMMFFQDPSLLQFQQRMEDETHMNNLSTMFQVRSIPKDSQMREVVDEVAPEELAPLFDDFFRPLQRGKHLEHYQILGGRYLVTLDGSQYFTSEKISCPGCLIREGKKGAIRYSHQIVQPALVHPGMRQVMPLCPEEVRNSDGQEKQDCEINAGKRALAKIRKSHPRLSLIVVGDGLYSKQPTIETIRDLHMDYVLVAKPDDHKKLMEWVGEMRVLEEVKRLTVQEKGRTHSYEWVRDMPLNDHKETVTVNYFEYWIEEEGKTTYRNSWITNLPVTSDNITTMVKAGRCRWKIENEGFNTLKNQGYHIEHNFGHGKKHLSFNFFLLNLLAFFMHQIFELTYLPYQKLRKKFGSKRNLWDHLRACLYIVIFPDLDTYFQGLLSPRRFPPEN